MKTSNSCTIYMLPDLWKSWRLECLKRDTTASTKIAELVAAQMKEWEQEELAPAKKPTPRKAKAAAA